VTVLHVIGKVMKVGATGLQHALHGAHGGDDLAIAF
jgi:hypothetical protein